MEISAVWLPKGASPRCAHSSIIKGSFSSPLFQGPGLHFPFRTSMEMTEVSVISDVFLVIILTLTLLHRTHTKWNHYGYSQSGLSM